ncbi:hypothetical protein PoB_005571700 [Plakobranchus ocellatus]|uniref:ZAD domain-containing protein n=1 Tax=Plakobranchus ocellatus TaxID=259542 RepID=A0AAV4CCZ6_9GAST|nr:hypothetical protein PoB_005571700 [Plakobranchus ocellatus]
MERVKSEPESQACGDGTTEEKPCIAALRALVEEYSRKEEQKDEELERTPARSTEMSSLELPKDDTCFVPSVSSQGIMKHLHKNHIDRLHNLCRLCARRCLNREQIRKAKKPRNVKLFQKDILILCHVNINNDIEDVHSPSICVKCTTNISNVKNFGSESTLNKLIDSEKDAAKIWTLFRDSVSEEECKLCSHYNSFNIGAKRAKSTDVTNVPDDLASSKCSVSSEPSTSIVQETEKSDTISGELSNAIVSDIYDQTLLNAADDDDIHMDYHTQNQLQ